MKNRFRNRLGTCDDRINRIHECFRLNLNVMYGESGNIGNAIKI